MRHFHIRLMPAGGDGGVGGIGGEGGASSGGEGETGGGESSSEGTGGDRSFDAETSTSSESSYDSENSAGTENFTNEEERSLGDAVKTDEKLSDENFTLMAEREMTNFDGNREMQPFALRDSSKVIKPKQKREEDAENAKALKDFWHDFGEVNQVLDNNSIKKNTPEGKLLESLLSNSPENSNVQYIPVEEVESIGRGKEGVYSFHKDVGGEMVEVYTGRSKDINGRLKDHIKGTGNKGIKQALQENTDLWVSYVESDDSEAIEAARLASVYGMPEYNKRRETSRLERLEFADSEKRLEKLRERRKGEKE